MKSTDTGRELYGLVADGSRRQLPTPTRPHPAVALRMAIALCPLLLITVAGCPSVGTGRSAPQVHGPVVTIAAVTQSASAGTPLEFTVHADPAPADDLAVTVTLDTAGCTLAQSLPDTVTIVADEQEATLTVPTTGVEVGADGCAVTLTIVAGDGYQVGEAAETSATATISDTAQGPRQPVVTIAADNSPVTEGDTVSFTLTATPAPASSLTVNVSWTESGSFLTGAVPQSVTIPTSGTATLSAATADDGTDEPHGSVTVSVGSGSGYAIGSRGSATISIIDDDGPDPEVPVVTIEAADNSSVVEGDTVSFTLTATPPPASSLTVNVSWTESGSFLTGAVPQSVTIPTSGTATLSAATADDGTDEPHGSVTVSVGSGSGYAIGSRGSATISIIDDDGPDPEVPVVTIEAADNSSVVEGDTVSFTLTATPPPASSLTVNVSWTESGSFLTGAVPQSVTIPTSGTATLSAATADDGTDEPHGSVTVSVGSGSGYAIGSPGSATVTVNDNDAASRTVSLQSVTPNPVTEGGTITITFSITPPFTEGTGALSTDRNIRYRVTDSRSPLSTVNDGIFVPKGAPTASTTYSTTDDPTVANRTIVVSVQPDDTSQNPTYTVGSPASMTISVTDSP